MAAAAREFGKRHIVQLRKLTIHYSPRAGSSAGTREYINEKLVEFATKRPSIVVEAKLLQDHRHPYLFAEYLNGRTFKVPLVNASLAEVEKQASLAASNSGKKAKKLQQPVSTENASIQGNWNPFMTIRQH